MNLKDVVKVTDKKEDEGVRVPWNETGDVGFILAYCGKGSISKARKNSLTKTHNFKTHQFDETLDDEKFDYEVMKATVKGWWGLKAKHLKEILDPSRFDLKEFEGSEEDVPVTDDNKDIIIRNYNLTFSRFVSSVTMDIEVYRKYQEEVEVKNS